jgi:uncharacterized protein
MSQSDRILIVGASGRAAAFSALRAGIVPRCVDYFADRDLIEVCAAERVPIDEGVSGLGRVALAIEPQALLYVGPIENHSDLVERLARVHHLCANGAETLRAVRDPLRVMEALRRHGLPVPEVRTSPEGLPRDGTWLVKPRASSGGRSIRFLDQQPQPPFESAYLQRWIDGPSFSAVFNAGQGRAELQGVTRQLLEAPGSAFAYRGSIGPWPLSAGLLPRLQDLGLALASAFHLVGLFGVDYILHDDEPWPVEVNPRYTASVEVLELALGRSLLAEHLRACAPHPPGQADRSGMQTHRSIPRVVGKAIIYADRSFVIPNISVDGSRRPDPFSVPAIADVPWPIQACAGDPVMTVFTSSPDISTCEAQLSRLEERWRRKLCG